MQINHSSFATTYQAVRHAQTISENPIITAEQKNERQQNQSNAMQAKRSAIVNIVDYKQTQNNLDTYIQSYQNATNGGSSTSSSNLTYQSIQDLNQTISRHQAANSNPISHIVDRLQNQPKPTPYYQSEQLTSSQAGGMINTFA